MDANYIQYSVHFILNYQKGLVNHPLFLILYIIIKFVQSKLTSKKLKGSFNQTKFFISRQTIENHPVEDARGHNDDVLNSNSREVLPKEPA